MHISKFRMVLVAIILSTILSISSVMSQLKAYYTIPSSGSIGPIEAIIQDYEGAYYSEMRGVFFHVTSHMPGTNYVDVVNTLATYNINTLIIESVNPRYAVYPSSVVTSVGIEFIPQVVQAAHSQGMEIYIAMNVLWTSPPGMEAVDHNGMIVAESGSAWMDPNKPGARNLIKAIVEELVTNYPEIDGFMFDYIRWAFQGATPDMSYGPEAKAQFEADLGEGLIADWTPFYPGGARYNEFLEWRSTVITELVGDMIGWMRAIKPDLKMTAAVWGRFTQAPDCGDPHKLIGQNWADWVMKDYLDWVAPMVYFSPADLEGLFRTGVRDDITLGVGGPEGRIPISIFIANQYPTIKTPQELKAEVDVLRQEGADGWIIWKYGGPGAEYGEDIRLYLNAIDMFDTFSISDVSISGDGTVTWLTSQPATSKVEFSQMPLFEAESIYDMKCDFYNLDVNHVYGTVVEDTLPLTSHSIKLPLNSDVKYYFQVRSQDSLGIATSKVYRFSISGVPG